ncbi:SufS family cysteine desulfurase [Firmicutes bacterium M10-2]|nr:SufS family cysteine desulfurase [Firmicutes bacterium M10-2]
MDIKENIEKIREDFPILKREMCNHPLIYLDNCATTLKPKTMIDAVVHYYTYLGANAHRGDYEMSAQVDYAYEQARKITQEFIHAKRVEEIVFTSGTTESLNVLAMTITDQWLNDGDVVLSTVAEHASNVLPWMEAGKPKNIKVEYIPLDEKGRLTAENFEKAITDQVKVVSIAQVTNVLGYEAPIKEITKIAHDHGIKVVVDGAQSVAHLPVDVQDLDVDFFCFSGHKMCAPTGIGVLYGKFELLEALTPAFFGGESNARFNKCGKVSLKKTPLKYESGTQPIEGALGLAAAMKYINHLGKENIHRYELELKRYFLEKIKDVEKVKVYNADAQSGIITFNVYDNGKIIFPQDVASFLNTKGIAIRSGEHCAKLLGEVLQVPGTCRASVYFYNTFEDIDKFVEALKEASFETCLDIFF